MTLKQNKMLFVMIGSAIIMLVSVFSLSYKFLGIGLLQFVVVVFIAFYSVWKDAFKLRDFANHLSFETESAMKSKKYFKASVYASVLPLIMIGILTIGLIIVCMLFVF